MYPVIKNYRKLFGNKRRVEKDPMIAVTFDDGYKTDYSVAYPYMTSRGIKGTSYLSTIHIDEALPERMSWTNITEMMNSGMWTAQCHTYRHSRLSEKTETEIRQQMLDVNSSFTTVGLPAPSHHAFPFGDYNATVQDIINDYRETMAKTSYAYTDINTYENFDYRLIERVTADINDDNKLQFVKNAIDYAIEQKGLLVLYWHEITPSIVAGSSTSTAQVYFEQIIDYIANSGIKSVTIDEMVNSVRSYRQRFGYE
jgi:peptidoglycan/xylan/chitin deacetylase (PgdA/CDA1 family)